MEHSVPPQNSYVIHSSWLQEPLATLIMRVGVHEAKIYRMPHMTQLKVELAPTGLKVTSTDPMIIEDHPDPSSVPNNDTMPMVLRGESFVTQELEASSPDSSLLQFRDCPRMKESEFRLEPTVHGKPIVGGLDM